MKKLYFCLLVLVISTVALSQNKTIGKVSAEVVEPVTYVKVSLDSLSVKVAVRGKDSFFVTQKNTTLATKNKKIKTPQIIINYN